MDPQTATIVILALQVALLVGGAVVAYLVKKGKIDRETVDDSKKIANTLAGSVDVLKETDPEAAEKHIKEILARIGEDKPMLDAFLKAMNLNPPKK